MTLQVVLQKWYGPSNRLVKRWWRRLDPLAWLCLGTAGLMTRLFPRVRRWQELRADHASAAAYGGELATRTLLKEWLVCYEFQTLAASHGIGDRPLDEPAANVYCRLVARWSEFSDRGLEYLRRRLAEEERPQPWDTHPTVAQRVEVQTLPPSGWRSDVG